VAIDKVFYNEASAAKLGWTPEWFDCKEYDEKLVRAIRKWQKERGITPDGMCGPSTHRRIYNERLADIDDYEPFVAKEKAENFIVHHGNFYPIDWPKVVLWSEQDGLKINKAYTPYFQKRKINMFLNHWDVCLDSTTCAKVLNNRGVSVHFCIDNDGTIYQLLDTNHAAWHGSSRKVNHASIGVEIANAYYPKYQSWYKKKGFSERPMIENAVVHGKKLAPFTGFYPVQIKALQALWKAVHAATGIPYKCPLDDNNKTSTTVDRKVARGTFKGFVSHYHVTKKKIDCAGLDIKTLLEEIK
tara:strand:+ start:1018 stop:1917 length:900 start_codon:yes stop_codon:yes gene_type:complete